MNLNVRAHEIARRLWEVTQDASSLALDVGNSLPIGSDVAWDAMQKFQEAVDDLKLCCEQLKDCEIVKDAYVDHPAYAYPRKES